MLRPRARLSTKLRPRAKGHGPRPISARPLFFLCGFSAFLGFSVFRAGFLGFFLAVFPNFFQLKINRILKLFKFEICSILKFVQI
jgi:hypothetical protein